MINLKTVAAALSIVVVTTSACTNEQSSITGVYGNRVVKGHVIMAASVGGSPAGVVAGIQGTGMSTTLGEDGEFFFAGISSSALLTFRRPADGIEAMIGVESLGDGKVVVELGVDRAISTRRRGATPPQQIEGTIKQVSATSIVVTSSHRVDVTAGITAETKIRKGNRDLTPADLAVGDRVHVKAVAGTGQTLVAVEIKLQTEDDDGEDANTVTANGTVASLGAMQFVVRTHPGSDITVRVDSNTQIKRQGRHITFADIRVGDRVESKGSRINESTILATKVELQPGSNNGRP